MYITNPQHSSQQNVPWQDEKKQKIPPATTETIKSDDWTHSGSTAPPPLVGKGRKA